MKGLASAFLVWTLLSSEGSGSQAWPMHTACKNGDLEVLYQSCGKVFQHSHLCLGGN